METTRLETFADGVFAIAATLLVLTVEVPRDLGETSLAHELAKQWPAYVAYAVSFVTIGIIWVNHHTVLGQLRAADRTFAVNVRSVFVATQAAVKHMKEGSRVINIGSCNAERMPFAGGAAYAMSKAALVGLVKGLARDLGPRGITVNNVQPGPVDTDLNPAHGDFAEMLKKLMALPRYAHGDEVAAMVAYLAGPEAGFVTGASLTIDGGFTA